MSWGVHAGVPRKKVVWQEMKRVLIIHANMELGGAETSLLGLLEAFDYTKVSVDLLLMDPVGELLAQVPQQVNVLPTIPAYQALVQPIKRAILAGHVCVAAARLWGKLVCAMGEWKHHYSDYGYIVKQCYHETALPFLPEVPGNYDLAISFNDPHYILAKKVLSKVRIGWFHTDYSRIDLKHRKEAAMWGGCDYAVNVSESCKRAFDNTHPGLKTKSIVVENILSKNLIVTRANAIDPNNEMCPESIRILSIGRYCTAKNFDNVPDICARLVRDGLDVKWYIIGFGLDEPLIKQKIVEAHMEDRVILLGKKENPYPYIKACDLYVQPSRYEGKSVCVREAQILCKPVVITNYATSASQLEDGVDGVIVPMDNEGCAAGIAALLRSSERMKQLAENCSRRDYTNACEVDKLYHIMNL